MDSNTLTHVAAIVVGVLVTLALVRSTSSSKPVAESANISENQKKKKKRKSKAAAKKATNSNDSTTSITTEDEPPASAVKEEEAPVVDNKENTSNGDNNNGAVKKKPKKKKNKAPANGASSGAPTNGSNGGAAKGKEANNNNASKNGAAAPVVAKAAPAVAKASSSNINHNTSNGGGTWQTPARAEEEWSSVGVTKKKKKNPTFKAASTTAAGPTTDSISVDAKKIGIIIGPKGATMIALQDATGCKLDINAPAKDAVPGRSAPPAKAGVVISGPDKMSIQMAKKAVLELATKGYATILQSDKTFGEFGTEVHPRFLAEIVGPNGKTIQAIQKTLGVKLNIPSTDWNPKNAGVPVKPAMVGIAGSKEASKTAKAVIQSLVKYHHHEITHPGMIHQEVFVPQEFFHCVIGVRGSEIKHIRGNYKVDMYMPNADSVSENVLVVGLPKNVEKSISYIQLLMDRDAESRQQKYTDEYY